ncbi:uncharacterized protein BX664DRAFT_338897 [Halteromyces radiatus]|uniref:uncharacterized protein n=1 Tax=Halteromyces radiatus TaxID=101107 RepID=UPI002220C353|nr:uncharacterized protein BX664DRAFT_338897 [Halteromyces radiatus]KAI8082710.1 hypothetical protein BX664DRAFT_338897 [Halteromyces radiatus]
MSRLLLFTVLLVLVCQTVYGHYQLTYPPSRGFSESNEPTGPCGGFNQVSSQRTEFPIKNGFLEINSEHPKYTYQVFMAIGNNPTASSFTGNNSMVAQGQVSYPAQSCLQVDLSSVQAATDGTNATLQIIYMAGDGSLYQVKKKKKKFILNLLYVYLLLFSSCLFSFIKCTDVTLKNQPSNFNTSACVNADGSSPSKSGSAGSQPTTSIATSLRTGGLMVFIAVMLSVVIA